MSETTFDFRRMLSPVDPETFFDRYWEKEPLIISGRDEDYYGDLISLEDVDDLIVFGTQGAEAVKLVKGRHPPYRNHHGPDRPQLNKAYSAYSQGYTVVINHLAARHKPVAHFIKKLEAFLNHPAQVNLYLTPANSQGFGAHYDTHDVFILQVAGEKHWRVYDPVLQTLPLQGRARPVPEQHLPAEPLHDLVLQPGDLLYLPRGFIHYACTDSCSSLHLTLGIHNVRWVELLTHALTTLSRRHVQLRESVPPQHLHDRKVQEGMEERFRELLALVHSEASLHEAVEQLSEALLYEQPPVPDGHFAQLDRTEELTLDTVLMKREGLLQRVVENGKYATVQFSGNKVTGPRKVSPALHFISTRDRFAVRDLPQLGDEEKVVLARNLVKEGFLRAV